MINAPTFTALREDLRLYESGKDSDGSPIWAIQDPVNNRFYRIGWMEYECLLRWPADPQQIADSINEETPLLVSADAVQQFGEFLDQHNLSRPTEQSMQRMLKQMNDPGWRNWKWWLHNYLFFRLPLIKPQNFLKAGMPFVRPLLSKFALIALILITISGVAMIARQWDVFANDFVQMLTPAGLLGFALALIVSKTLHELGHAFVATHYGVRVGHMGVAFLVMWPMLYTDTGESWRLKSSHQRLAISVAGVSAELALAGIATFMWGVMDDGALRQAMLYLATTGWILSLALNVSPFMRFDGYFILSDILDFPNLHERAGRTAKTWLRRKLLGFEEEYHEAFSPKKLRFLVGFALLTWLYRLTVFLGIAIAVYIFFFKLLGIFLMLVELAWFVARPIWSEVSVWIKRRSEIKTKNRIILFIILTSLLLFLIIPWNFSARGYAVARPMRIQQVFTPFPAQVVNLKEAGTTTKGSLLASFKSPDFDLRSQRSLENMQALDTRISGLIDDNSAQHQTLSLRQQLQEQITHSEAAQTEAKRLNITAQFDGLWLDIDPLIKPDVWVNNNYSIGILVDPSSWVIDGYIEERDIDKISLDSSAKFYPENNIKPLDAKVIAIDDFVTKELPYVSLADRHGGSIATYANSEKLIPSQSLYRIRLSLNQPIGTLNETKGKIHISGAKKSILLDAGKTFVSVLLRESGF